MSDPQTRPTGDAGELSELRARYDDVAGRLERAEQGGGEGDRDRLRDDIVALFRDVDHLLGELGALKESIRPLVERYRVLFRRPDAPPPPPPQAPASVRVDHLGSSTHAERGWSLIAAEQYAEAEAELERALSLAPGDGRAEALLGWAQMRRDRLDDAEGTLESLLAREPDNALARANLGYVRFRQGRFAEAIEQLSRAQRAVTDRTATLYANLYLGMVYAEREMYRDAEGFFQRALELGPNLIEAYWELGWSHYRAGRAEQAVEAWRRGAEVNRFNAWGERCRQAAQRAAAGEPVSRG